ncbi:MAG: XRE family transcriptional regulator [Candidatus Thioglobus sp.]|nr:XRE family transcriptional regulator [Candidatus Thioglobus sp.]
MNYKELGQFIAQIRKEKKCSQQILSDHLGISRATISALEKGRVGDVGVRKIMKILDYLGYEIAVRERSPFPTLEELRDE